MVMPRSRSMSIRSRYWARISRSATTPVSCSIRSASVDLPWSIWAMMQKFRICAGAVKVWSAKLLMGISWSDGARHGVRYQGIEAGASRHNRGTSPSLMLENMAPPWKTFQRFAENLVFNEAPKFIRQLQQVRHPAARHPAGHQVRLGRDQPAPPNDDAPCHHRGPSGQPEQRPHRPAGPQAGVRARSRRPRRSRRDRLDLGGLRGRPDARQGPPGAGGGP